MKRLKTQTAKQNLWPCSLSGGRKAASGWGSGAGFIIRTLAWVQALAVNCLFFFTSSLKSSLIPWERSAPKEGKWSLAFYHPSFFLFSVIICFFVLLSISPVHTPRHTHHTCTQTHLTPHIHHTHIDTKYIHKDTTQAITHTHTHMHQVHTHISNAYIIYTHMYIHMSKP